MAWPHNASDAAPQPAVSTICTALAAPAILSSSGASTRLNAAKVRAQCISSGTVSRYKSYLNGIRKWVMSNKNIHNPHRFFDGTGQLDPKHFTPKEFEDFLLSKQGKLKTITLGGYRSVMRDLYRKHSMAIPPEFGEPMKTLFSGLKRMEADQDQSDSSPRNSGKQPLHYSLYSKLCRETMSRNDSGFAHLFLVTQWNLMCRSKSVETVSKAHLVDADDSIGCILHKTKPNQEGSGQTDPRHLYANPLSPDTCWVTALAIYLACNPRVRPGPLFPGSSQKIRFSKVLSAAINDQCEAKEYGTHSIRKGVDSFACGGSTVAPSIISACLRCGWSLGGVQDRYFRDESAGDQYLGRVVAGLPVNKSAFAILPPHFGDQQDPTVLECVEQMFPSLKSKSNLSGILKLCLASLVYHAELIRSRLPTTHSLLSTYLFQNASAMQYLRGLVWANDSPWMCPSGIPPHIEMYKQQEDTNKAMKGLLVILLDGFSKLLGEKGVAAGHVTKTVLENTIRQLLAEAGLGGDVSVPCEQAGTDVPQQPLGQYISQSARGFRFSQHISINSMEIMVVWKCVAQLPATKEYQYYRLVNEEES